MKVIKETIDGTTIFIQIIDEDLEILEETKNGGRFTQVTGIEEEIHAIYAKTKSLIKNIAEDIGAEIKSLQASTRPKQVEMEFNVGISAQAGPIWILSGKGDYALKVKMTWEFESR